MSNSQLDALLIAVFVLHVGVLAMALFWPPGRPAMLWLNAADAVVALALQAPHPMAFRPPVDWQVVGFAAFEIVVLAIVVLALRGVRIAWPAAWVVFALHLVASGLAVAFALTFKITRLF